MSGRIDPTALSHWFPKIEAAGLPVPRTKLFKMPADVQQEIWEALDGKPGEGRIADFAKQVAVLAADFAFPIFLRTDHTSGKHEWRRTCFVTRPEDIGSHLVAIAEYSEMVGGIMGMPWDSWAIREMLPTIPLAVCPAFGDMPVCREFRFFVENDIVLCAHPYWPAKALQQGGVGPDAMHFYESLCRMDDEPELHRLASAAGKAVGGAWSVDILETRRGWVITDMAEAHKSFHWEGCPVGERLWKAAGQ